MKIQHRACTAKRTKIIDDQKEHHVTASTCLSATQVSVRLAPVQGSTLGCTITTFYPVIVSLPLSSPGDVY